MVNCMPLYRRLLVALTLIGLLAAWPAVAAAQGPNLIQNPSFDEPYVTLPAKENCAIAAPWVAWYQSGSEKEQSQGYRLAPEYKAAFRRDFPGNRVRTGDMAQQYFHSYGNFEAGILQQVPGIPVGARVRFEIWGMTWSCDKEDKGNCEKATSGDPSPMHFKIGIDPTGGGNVFSSDIIWSPEQNAYDAWHKFEVEAVAKNSTVTCYVYTYPEFRSQDNNVYLDDASLVIVQPPATPTRVPTRVPTVAPTAAPTNTPLPTVVPTVTPTAMPTVVPPTPCPPQPTCPPANTPAPCPTCPPVVIPTPIAPTALQQATALPALLLALVLAALGLLVGMALGRRSE